LWFTSKDVDLTNGEEFEAILKTYKPQYVIHLAGRVGGITDNMNNQKEFLEQNILVNTNVIKAVDKFNIPTISLSSSCCYPRYDNISDYPLTEDKYYLGQFEQTNYTYALAKAVMMEQIHLSSNRHVCIAPCNLIGPHDHFNSSGSHFVPAMIRKLVTAQREGKKKIQLLGTGESCRQFMDVRDLCEFILYFPYWSWDRWDKCDKLINIGPQRQMTIKEAATIIRDKFAPEVEIEFDNNYKFNGVYRKDISDEKLTKVLGREFEYTPFEDTIDYLRNDKNLVIT
jgi:GDP-L-fucose synthase